MLPDLAAILRAEGVRVRELGPWRAHVRPGSFAPRGNMVHHTGDKGTGDSGLDVLRFGRPDLSGPLCNGSPREDGTVVLLSAGRANHAGRGSGLVLDRISRGLAPLGSAHRLDLPDTTVGNGYFYGWEVDNDGLGQPYPEAQIAATVACCVATSRAHGWGPERTVLHGEWSRRKSDWSFGSGEQLRDLISDGLRATYQEDDVDLTDKDVERIAQRTRQVLADGQQAYGLDNLRRLLVTLIDLTTRAVEGHKVTRTELDAGLDGLPQEVVDEIRARLNITPS